ncbi:hypothetical protein LXA43DRAFT_368484 [Ganoderma leucocontextum]|nr:hypothetical protein LXA43DRAFT_368484 [Ganoderma leucocontextum]
MNRRQDLPVPEPQDILFRPCKERVVVRRPVYNAELLYLPALSTGSTATPYGVFRPLVLDACRVLTNRAANNQDSEDFLATDIEGRDRVEINDEPLDVDCYYFLGPPDVEANRNYPIVKTLSAFTFPSVLPDRWAQIARQRPPSRTRMPPPPASDMSALVKERDWNCAVTRWPDSTQCAHLIPEAEAAWYFVNQMHAHILGKPPAVGPDHPANGILLRGDVQLCLDSHGFLLYPDNNPADDQRFVAYFVRWGYPYLSDLFHRRPVTIDPEIPVEFLYVRFAYAIINHPRVDSVFKYIPESRMVTVVRERMEEERRQRSDVGLVQMKIRMCPGSTTRTLTCNHLQRLQISSSEMIIGCHSRRILSAGTSRSLHLYRPHRLLLTLCTVQCPSLPGFITTDTVTSC